MKPVHLMTSAELIEEARRREERRRRNLPLTDADSGVGRLSSGPSVATQTAIATLAVASQRLWRYEGPQTTPPSGRTEAKEQGKIFALMRLAGADQHHTPEGETPPGAAYWLSQPRETKQTPGIPDCVFVWATPTRRCQLWWETKVEGSEISEAQLWFRAHLRALQAYQDDAMHANKADVLEYGMGDLRAAADWLVARGWAEYDPTEDLLVRTWK